MTEENILEERRLACSRCGSPEDDTRTVLVLADDLALCDMCLEEAHKAGLEVPTVTLMMANCRVKRARYNLEMAENQVTECRDL